MKSDRKIERICLAVAQLIKEERLRRKLSMASLAEAAGLSQPHISYIERGLRVPSLDTLLRITEALELDFAKFIIKATK